MRGCVVGIIAGGAIRFSEQLNERDRAKLQRWGTFNEALWGGLAFVTIPGMAVVTKVCDIACRLILKKTVTVRDFKATMYQVLSDVEQRHVLLAKRQELSPAEAISAESAMREGGTLMDWISIALHANGLP